MKSIKALITLSNRNFFIFGLILLSLTSRGQRQPSNIISPEILADHSVVFRIKAPAAKTLQVSGTWATGKKTDMIKLDSIWEVKIGPLPSDMYEYDIIMNGIPMLDPLNNMVTRDGAWIQNRLMVPGDMADLIDAKSVPHGDLKTVWYSSPSLDAERRMLIYTPPGYAVNKQKYPVLYLLHGGGGDEEAWINRGRANYILDNLIAAGKVKPMIVIMTNGNPSTPATPLDRPITFENTIAGGISAMASGKFEESFVKDVIPYIEKNYRVIADANHRAITGFSMGGYQTQNITNNNPTTFKYIGVMSMGLFSSLQPNKDYSKEKHIKQLKDLQMNNLKVYWIGIGKQDFLYQSAVKLRALYDEIGFKYTYRENEGQHDWNSWRMYLMEFSQLIFK